MPRAQFCYMVLGERMEPVPQQLNSTLNLLRSFRGRVWPAWRNRVCAKGITNLFPLQPFDSATSDRTRISMSDTTSEHLRISTRVRFTSDSPEGTKMGDNSEPKTRKSKWTTSNFKMTIPGENRPYDLRPPSGATELKRQTERNVRWRREK
jgi:hypothetical protein